MMMAMLLHYYGALSVGFAMGFGICLVLSRALRSYLRWRRRRLWFATRELRYR